MKTGRKKGIKTGALLLGASLAMATHGAAESLFEYNQLGSGATLRGNLVRAGFTANPMSTLFEGESKTGEEAKCGEGKCGEGKCGEEKQGHDKSAEGKCGEGKCGEGKCGE